jgi:hypothetical protein
MWKEDTSMTRHERRSARDISARRHLLAVTVGCTALTMASVAAAGMLEFEFDKGNFTASTNLSNDFWGLKSGGPTSAVYFSESDDGCEVGESVVTGTTGTGFFSDTYDIDAVVVRDREWVSEECDGSYVLVEDTFDWYAQDDEGRVWYLGEATQAYDDEEDCLTAVGSWKAGEDEAEPGVILLADPSPGVAYQQEYYEGEAEDRARILRLNANVSIDFGDYMDCLHTKEYTPLSPGEVEHKFYCRLSQGGVGLTLINELKGKTRRVEYVGTGLPAGTYPSSFPTSDLCGD